MLKTALSETGCGGIQHSLTMIFFEYFKSSDEMLKYMQETVFFHELGHALYARYLWKFKYPFVLALKTLQTHTWKATRPTVIPQNNVIEIIDGRLRQN